jgi:hypothetical protein
VRVHRSLSVFAVIGLLVVGRVPAARAQGTDLSLLGYHTTAPAGWIVQPPSSKFRLAQFTVPGPDSANDAEVVVYFFGPQQGGTPEANMQRWHAQFSTAGAPPPFESVRRDSSGAFPITIAEYRGTYRRGVGMGSADSVRANQALVVVVAETPRGTMFLQLFGPDSVIAGARGAFLQFAKDLK